ncbi:hypothetical protein BD324DRAFT_585204 [Kockovaella imperatae]|uniref:Uncharacterized protein n=1 Tax=Kockovaella imperatae TaxID=4999 RepID=A0A1Y1U7B2_9TREE|nr:hypothetical protein BD324DRAFT_585204 [Kockovaella imperatae]ORX33387.1 hypothetical protein BD324DRAFT_585204 [Kockovaella imperatae]
MSRDQQLYHKLQNLEDHPDAIDLARERLIQLLDESVHAAQDDTTSLLAIPTYSKASLHAHFDASHAATGDKYRAYIERRKAGGPRELYPTRDHAVLWLRLAACVKYVDGGWLSNVLNIGTASSARRAARIAWQVMTEEFGDGDLGKNHVYIYHELLKTLDDEASRPGDKIGFDGFNGQGVARCWKAAVAQQCIGLMAGSEDFLPEALGFNMAYETLAYHLLVESYELRELKIDDYYFALHITIDNPDCGHAAMGLEAVDRYLKGVLVDKGPKEQDKAWRRVQAGAALADGLPTTPWNPIEFEKTKGGTWRPTQESPTPATLIESQVADLFRRKSTAASGLHCALRLRLQGRSVEEWLDPRSMSSAKIVEFVRALAGARPWIVPGRPAKSRLVKEMTWGGRMFGAFSDKEVGLIRRWIQSLDPGRHVASYERHVGSRWPTDGTTWDETIHMGPQQLDIATDERVQAALSRMSSFETEPLATLDIVATIQLSDNASSAAVWLTHLSLLDHFGLSPSKLATPLGMCVMRALRAQNGFPALHERETICAGLEEEMDDKIGLWDLGQEVFRRLTGKNGSVALDQLWDHLAPPLTETLEDMLALRSRPYSSSAYLLGISYACSDLRLPGAHLNRTAEKIQLAIQQSVRSAIEEHLKTLEKEDGGRFWQACRSTWSSIKQLLR